MRHFRYRLERHRGSDYLRACLTKREPAGGRRHPRSVGLEVLQLMAQGRSNRAIGERLQMSQKTLEAHIRQILQKLQLPESEEDHRRVLAVLAYLRSIG